MEAKEDEVIEVTGEGRTKQKQRQKQERRMIFKEHEISSKDYKNSAESEQSCKVVSTTSNGSENEKDGAAKTTLNGNLNSNFHTTGSIRSPASDVTAEYSAGGVQIHALLGVLDTLKHLPRTGWLHHCVPQPVESVAAHMYRMAVLAMTLPSTIDGIGVVDVNRCVRMALVHDIGEAFVGDLTPKCGVSALEKHLLEEEALQKIGTMVPQALGSDWVDLWREYDAKESPTARVVAQLDKFDMLAQAWDYELRFANINLDEFFESTRNSFHTEPFITWAQGIFTQRAAHRLQQQERGEQKKLENGGTTGRREEA